MMLMLGMGLTIPASLLAGLAPSDGVLFVARLLGGVAAGMAYPTTLALITALWSGAARTRSIALWSAIGGAIAALGPLLSGALLEHFDWGSVFLVTLPLAAARPVHGLALRARPTSTRRPSRSTTSAASSRSCWSRRWCWGSTSPRCPARGRWRSAWAWSRSRRRRRSSSASAGRAAALRPRGGCAAHLLGRGLRRDHRLRLADGGDVHRPAVPPERARLLDPRLRRWRSCRRRC